MDQSQRDAQTRFSLPRHGYESTHNGDPKVSKSVMVRVFYCIYTAKAIVEAVEDGIDPILDLVDVVLWLKISQFGLCFAPPVVGDILTVNAQVVVVYLQSWHCCNQQKNSLSFDTKKVGYELLYGIFILKALIGEP